MNIQPFQIIAFWLEIVWAIPIEAVEELNQVDLAEGSSVVPVTVQAPQSSNIFEVVQPDRFSRISRLIRITALVLKFINKIRRNAGGHPEITAEEMDAARILWLNDSQTKFKEKEKSSLTWEQLGAFKDDSGELRWKGSIQNSSLPYSVKFLSCHQENSTSRSW